MRSKDIGSVKCILCDKAIARINAIAEKFIRRVNKDFREGFVHLLYPLYGELFR